MLLPAIDLAISFFTFIAVSDVVDVHRGVLKPARPMDVINGIVQAQAAVRPGDVTYLDSKPVLGDGQGTFTAYSTNGSGAELNIRTTDGIHLTPDGGRSCRRR
jgi:hypothetical protein